MSGERGCSVSESISVVSQMKQTISGRDTGELECFGLRTWLSLAVCADYLVSIKPEQFFIS